MTILRSVLNFHSPRASGQVILDLVFHLSLAINLTNIISDFYILAISNMDRNQTFQHQVAQAIPHTISVLTPFSALILSIVVITFFLIRFYILDRFLLRRCYGDTYSQLDETTRRSFVNHHIAGATKLLILIIAAYPFVSVLFVKDKLHTPYFGSHLITLGDILLISAQMLIAIYVFEIIYRPKISPVSVAHHIGTILIGQSVIAFSLDSARRRESTNEFILCTIWGAFDIVSELIPHISIILYRVRPTSHALLRNVFRIACIITLTSTVAETALTMGVFGSWWSEWSLAFKIITPILHIIFSSAQLWGSWNLYNLYRKQTKLLKLENSGEENAMTEVTKEEKPGA